MRKQLAVLIATFWISLTYLAMPVVATVDNATCTTADAGATCSASELSTSATEEVGALSARAPMKLSSVSGGATNTYTASAAPTLTSLGDYGDFRFKPDVTNSGASTLNIDTLGALPIVNAKGDALTSGDLRSDSIYLLSYFAASPGPQFRVLTALGAGGTATGIAGGDLTGSYPNPTVAADAVALTTDTTGSYVGTVADGTGIDGTASAEGATYTPTLDLTEVSSGTWGAGTFTAFTFDAGAVDPVMTFGSGTLTLSAITAFNLDDEGEFRLFEEDAGGANYVGFKAPAALTASVTCTFEDDANPIPDSCVGNGSDADTLGSDGDKGDITVGGTGTTLAIDAGAVNDTALAAGAVDGGNLGEIADGSVTTDDLGTDSVSADELNATGVEAELEAVLDLPSLQGDLALGTQSSGNYVLDVADGTGIDGTAAAEGATYTPTLDLTEINSTTFGSGTFTALTFNAGAVDPVFTFGSGTLDLSALTTLGLDDEGEFRFFEEDAGGGNYVGFKAPAALTASVTCTFENDANPIPDSCVGDGSDSGGTLSDADYGDITVSGTGTVFSVDAGAVAVTDLAASTSANLRGVISDEVGTGALMFGLDVAMEDGLSCTGSQVVRRNAGDTAFECATVAGTGDVSKVGTPANDQIGVWTGDGTLEGTSALTFTGSDVVVRVPTNDASPALEIGATSSEQLHVSVHYDTGAQTVDYVDLHTDVASATADKGLFRFSPDGVAVLDIDDGGINFAASKGISIAGTDILTDAAGTATLSNIDALNATTTATIQDALTESFCVAASDESTAITTGTAKVTFRMPYAFTLTNIRGSLNTVSSSGSPLIDINEGGTSVATTNKLLIDVSEKTSVTAATAITLTDTALADDAEMTIDIDTAGTGAKGLKVCLIGHQ